MATYKTQQGDMWDLISYRVYGSEMHTDELFKANTQYADIAVFSAGIILQIPEIEDTVTILTPPWLKGNQNSNETAAEKAPIFDFVRSREPSYRLVERYVKIMTNNTELHF